MELRYLWPHGMSIFASLLIIYAYNLRFFFFFFFSSRFFYVQVMDAFTMETTCQPGRIVVSERVRDALVVLSSHLTFYSALETYLLQGQYYFREVTPTPQDANGNPIPAFMFKGDFEHEDSGSKLNALDRPPSLPRGTYFLYLFM